MIIRNLLLAAASVAMLGACVPSGGGERPPTFGSTELQEGFTPDPLTVQVRAGGGANAQNRFAGSCMGYIDGPATYRVRYRLTQQFYPLNFYVNSDADTTLVVRQPDGRVVCDDDGWIGRNPLASFGRPQNGNYDIWVGTYASNAGQPAATLYVSQLPPPDRPPQPGGGSK